MNSGSIVAGGETINNLNMRAEHEANVQRCEVGCDSSHPPAPSMPPLRVTRGPAVSVPTWMGLVTTRCCLGVVIS